ncbi:HPr family phosphocarrier protein [Mucilaginibacter sp. ZT4R22]|uniref:Phosphocarrier protein HPr n=1 Tax=Mucilaginibacter pankratovii TaxID=2772110 RepID=A0ABR7WKN9_9SPHI|nr:HPr family phosphocarrier protein [Mucilaginibacter pankratovii]MBD1362736.1 HPr family phosphocarrier protein [Mucilaginibacter pankratovii]
MITKGYTITSAQGMHARPATQLVKLAKEFSATISIKKGDKTVKMNSLLNILLLSIKSGETVALIIDGADEVSAAVAIDIFFTDTLKHL